jgi:ketosteroid isomerase-like protein
MADTVGMGTATGVTDAMEIVRSMCIAYASAVNASDSLAYSKLFTPDAIRMPPGSEPEHGPEQIRRGEQADYDAVRLSIRSTPVDAVQTSDEWVYGIAHIEGTATNHVDGMTSSFRAAKTWLLQRQASGEWLIARQMWNMR